MQLFMAYAVLAYSVTALTVYAVASLIQIQSMLRRVLREKLYIKAFPHHSPLCAVSSQSPSLASPPWCGSVGRSGLRLVSLFFSFLCQSFVRLS